MDSDTSALSQCSIQLELGRTVRANRDLQNNRRTVKKLPAEACVRAARQTASSSALCSTLPSQMTGSLEILPRRCSWRSFSVAISRMSSSGTSSGNHSVNIHQVQVFWRRVSSTMRHWSVQWHCDKLTLVRLRQRSHCSRRDLLRAGQKRIYKPSRRRLATMTSCQTKNGWRVSLTQQVPLRCMSRTRRGRRAAQRLWSSTSTLSCEGDVRCNDQDCVNTRRQ